MQRVSVHGSPALSHGFDGFIDYLRDQEVGASALSPKRFGEVFEKILLTGIRKLSFFIRCRVGGHVTMDPSGILTSPVTP